MLKIRLMRIGAKKIPFYRVVVVDERSKRTGGYLELLGTYNPLTEPKDIKLKQDRIDHWIKQGAQPSTGYLRIIGKAPQRPPRKPKKEKQESESQKESNESKAKEENIEKEQTSTETPVAENAQTTEEPKQEEQPAAEEGEKKE
ncbi:30S ribosomal protein S16 [Candidatus Daviesbacteria bacterium]|nr:30S ribosomal protein S16 [Candidatus Daviesbacteria bacterium]